jgi:hypothetical protein
MEEEGEDLQQIASKLAEKVSELMKQSASANTDGASSIDTPSTESEGDLDETGAAFSSVVEADAPPEPTYATVGESIVAAAEHHLSETPMFNTEQLQSLVVSFAASHQQQQAELSEPSTSTALAPDDASESRPSVDDPIVICQIPADETEAAEVKEENNDFEILDDDGNPIQTSSDFQREAAAAILRVLKGEADDENHNPEDVKPDKDTLKDRRDKLFFYFCDPFAITLHVLLGKSAKKNQRSR